MGIASWERGETVNDSRATCGGVGFVGALTIAFVVMKLCGVIDWGWQWVLSPIWITTAFVLLVSIGTFIACLVKVWRDDD